MKEPDVQERSISAPSTPTDTTRIVNGCTLKTRNKGRRVNFPADNLIVSGYFDAPNPWNQDSRKAAGGVLKAYRAACERSRVRPIESLVAQLEDIEAVDIGKKNLNLKGVKMDAVQCEPLEEIFKRIQFQNLDLETCQMDDEAAAALFDMVEYYESARSISLSFNRTIDSLGWQACSRLLKKSSNLEQLSVRNTSLTEHTLLLLGRALRFSSSLSSLRLDNCGMSGRSLVILVASLKMNTSIQELHLTDNKLSSTDALQLSNLLRENYHIRLLDLAGNNLQDGGVKHLSEGCSQQHQPIGFGLHSLVLCNNHISHNGSAAMANLMSSCQGLEGLDLSHNPLTNEGVHRLKQTLISSRSLTDLNLRACKLSCEGAIALAEYIADNRSIQKLDLRDNEIRVAGVLALALSLRKHNSSLLDLKLNPAPCPTGFLFSRQDEAEVRNYQEHVKEINLYCIRNQTTPPSLAPTAPPPIIPVRATRFTVSRVILDPSPLASPSFIPSAIRKSTDIGGAKPLDNTHLEEPLINTTTNESHPLINLLNISSSAQISYVDEEEEEIPSLPLSQTVFLQIDRSSEESSNLQSLASQLALLGGFLGDQSLMDTTPENALFTQPSSKLLRLCKHLEGLDLKSTVPLSPSHLMDNWGFPEPTADVPAGPDLP